MVRPSGASTGSRMNPVHFTWPDGSTRPSITRVALPPPIGTVITLGTSIRYRLVTPLTLQKPITGRVRTKRMLLPSGAKDGIESLLPVVTCVAAASAWTQMFPSLA